MFAQYHEAMGEAFRHPELAVILGRQVYTHPLAEIRRASADIDGYVQHFTGGDAHQFALGVFELVMQAAQHAFLRARVVVLHKLALEPGGPFKGAGVEAFVEKTALITEHFGFDDQYAGQ